MHSPRRHSAHGHRSSVAPHHGPNFVARIITRKQAICHALTEHQPVAGTQDARRYPGASHALCYHPKEYEEYIMQESVQDLAALRARIDDLLVRL